MGPTMYIKLPNRQGLLPTSRKKKQIILAAVPCERKMQSRYKSSNTFSNGLVFMDFNFVLVWHGLDVPHGSDGARVFLVNGYSMVTFMLMRLIFLCGG